MSLVPVLLAGREAVSLPFFSRFCGAQHVCATCVHRVSACACLPVQVASHFGEVVTVYSWWSTLQLTVRNNNNKSVGNSALAVTCCRLITTSRATGGCGLEQLPDALSESGRHRYTGDRCRCRWHGQLWLTSQASCDFMYDKWHTNVRYVESSSYTTVSGGTSTTCTAPPVTAAATE